MDRKSSGPEVKWTGQVDRKSSDRKSMDRKSSGQEVNWTGSQVDRKSSGPEVTWTGSHVDRKSRGPEVTWTGSHVDRKSRGPEFTWTGSHVDRKIDGQFLTNLRFADDIFLCTETPQELQQMLQELSDESRRMDLKMNIAKTKVMVVDNTPINVNNVPIENVEGYVYLGQRYSLKEKNQDKEIQRIIMAGWAAYAKPRDIFKSNLAICLKRQVYNSCVLPAMTYGAETCTLTKQAQNKLAAAQTKMERSMLNITYKDRKTNIWVREKTKVIDIISNVRKMK